MKTETGLSWERVRLTHSLVFIGKGTRGFANGPSTESSLKVKVWQLVGGLGVSG